MKNSKKILLLVFLLIIGIQLVAVNPKEILRKAREDYYKKQLIEKNAKKEEERLEKLKKMEEERVNREKIKEETKAQ